MMAKEKQKKTKLGALPCIYYDEKVQITINSNGSG